VPTPTATTETVRVSSGSGVAVGVASDVGERVALGLGLGGLDVEHPPSTRAEAAPNQRGANRRRGIATILE